MWMKSGGGWDIAKSSLVDKTFLKCIHICYQVPLMCIVQDTSKSSGSKTWRKKHICTKSHRVCALSTAMRNLNLSGTYIPKIIWLAKQ